MSKISVSCMYRFHLFLGIILVGLILSIGIRSFSDTIYTPIHLQNDGVVLLPGILSSSDRNVLNQAIESEHILEAKKYIMNSKTIRKKIDKLLGNDYVFQDYIFLIKRSQFHTCLLYTSPSPRD